MMSAEHRHQVSQDTARRNRLTGLALAFIVLLVCLIAISSRV